MTIRRFLLALLLSSVITFGLVAAYLFYPLVMMLLREDASGPGTGGIASAAGGSGIRSTTLLIIEPIVFVIVLTLISRKRTNE